MVATILSLPPATANTSPAHVVTVRPGRMTRARATIRSPRAGAKKLTLYSTVSTDVPAGISVIAAYPPATSTMAVSTAAAMKP
jgi:hypothetical protein